MPHYLKRLLSSDVYILVQPSGSALNTLKYQTNVKQTDKNTPLTPNVGPWEGCRRQAKEFSLR